MRRGRLAGALILLAFGCEDEKLLPSSNFNASRCSETEPCAHLDGGSLLLDGGFAPGNGFGDDTGVVSGQADSLTDAGLIADAGGAVDSGASLDSGAPLDSGASSDTGAVGDSGIPADTGVPPDTGIPPDSGLHPDAAPVFQFLDLSGNHQTHYVLDLSNYLGGIGNLAGPLDTIDQALAGNINTGISILDQLISAAIAQFIPPWVVTVIDVLNDVANFFEEVDTFGVMSITQDPPNGGTAGLHASEVWNTLMVRIIDQCPLGRMDPSYPGCAQQSIPIAMRGMVGPLEIGVDVHDFDGVLQAGRPAADFRFDDREVDMELTKLVRVVIDLAINLGTNGQITSLRDALDQAIDCAALEREAQMIAAGFLPAFLARAAAAAVRRSCDQEKQNALDAIVGGIEGIGVGWEVMEFDQIGAAVDTNGNGRPERLQTLGTPDTIDGRFRLLVSNSMGGVWEGTGLNP